MSEPEVIDLEVGKWHGESPFFLILELDEKPPTGNVGIDLDEGGWTTKYADHMRAPGTWWLVHKPTQRAMMGLVVEAGDQPYFVKRHIGNLMAAREVVAYGLGKKRANGEMVRIWLLPNGMICGGDDVEIIASRMVNG